MNLKIGYAAAFFLMILAFSWETEKPIFKDPFEELPIDDVMIIPPTVQEQAKEPPPPDLPEKKVLENVEIVESTLPNLLSTDLTLTEPAPPAEHVSYSGPTPQPIVKSPPPPVPANDDIPFKIVEDMPLFGQCNNDLFSKGEKKKCSDAALLAFLYKNIRYPAIARENGVEGLVVIQFIVEKDGSITAAKLLRDIGAGCGQEALRVVNEMPKWTPGRQRGREVRVQYNLPVKFALN